MLDPRREDGVALLVALAVMLVLTITTVTAVNMATSSQNTTGNSVAIQSAADLAQGGVNNAEAMLNYDLSNNINPSSPTDFGCGTGTSGASNCATYTALSFCLQTTTCTAGTAGTASVYGWFSGTNPGTFDGQTVAASTWLIVSTGYATGAGGIESRARTATITVSALNSGAVAAVWNHIFLTAPLVPNVCQTTYSGTNQVINAPIYIIGNLCLTGTNTAIQENGQPVDLEVGGKLVIAGNNATVGSSGAKITSGVVVGGCATAIANTATACTGSPWSTSDYYVKTTDTFTSQAAPTLTTTNIESDYSTFDPGPKHPCASGTTPAAPTGGTTGSMFDSTISSGEGSTMAPDNSGSVTNGTSFNLTPNSSYACISTSGTGTGYLIWNNSSSTPLTVSGITVPAQTLAINGSIYFDSNVTASQNFTYSGTGVIEFSGSFTTGQTICAVWNGSTCDFAVNDWQGSSNKTSMLTLVSTATSNSTAIDFTSTNGAFQGSLWTQPSSTAVVGGTNYVVEGPMAVGTLSITGTNAQIYPLPVIKNMPTGAPVPPNTGATIGTPGYTS